MSTTNASTTTVPGSVTDVLSNRRLPATASGNKPAGDNPNGSGANGANGNNGHAASAQQLPHGGGGGGVDVTGIAKLLQGVVLDKDDAVAALNKLLQRALRAVPYVKLQHCREVLERVEQCIAVLESHCSDADLEARLTPGSRVSRLKFDSLKNMAMRDDGTNSMAHGVQRVVIPDNRLNAIPGPGQQRAQGSDGGALSDATLRSTPTSSQRAAAVAAASLSSLQMAAMVGTKAGPPSVLAAAANSSSATPGSGGSSGGGGSSDAAPAPVYVPLPTKILPTSQFTKDFDSPSMARRTLAGATRQARRVHAPSSDSDDDETKKGESSAATSTSSASSSLGLGLRGASAGGGGEAMKPRNKLLDKVAGGHVRSSSRAALPPTLASTTPAAAQPSSSTTVSSVAANTSSMDSPNLGGRRLGGGGGGKSAAHQRAQSSLLSAATSTAHHNTKAAVDAADDDEQKANNEVAATVLNDQSSLSSSGLIAPPPSVANTPAHTPNLPSGELVLSPPSTEEHRTQLQRLLQRALRLVPAFQYSPAAFRQLHTQLETAVAFMEERCGAVPIAANGNGN